VNHKKRAIKRPDAGIGRGSPCSKSIGLQPDCGLKDGKTLLFCDFKPPKIEKIGPPTGQIALPPRGSACEHSTVTAEKPKHFTCFV
jgi:hypothetical protein